MSTPNEETATRRIDVVSDVVCPWCFIGKRRLEAMFKRLDEAGEPRPEVRWMPFQLNPDLPLQGVDRQDYLDAKFGGPERVAQINTRVAQAGESAGITFEFSRIRRQPNTRDAHRLIEWAQRDGGDANRLVERLFTGHFLEGRAIGDRDELARLAGEAGLDAAAAARMLSTADDGGVSEQEQVARDLGIEGVPFFIFNRRVAVSGAQEAALLHDAWKQSLQPAEGDGPVA